MLKYRLEAVQQAEDRMRNTPPPDLLMRRRSLELERPRARDFWWFLRALASEGCGRHF